MFATPAASPPPTPRTATSRDLRRLMSTSLRSDSIADLKVRDIFRGLSPDMPTSALGRVYHGTTDWSTDTAAELRMACQGLDQATGRLIGGLPLRESDLPHDTLLRFCRRMCEHCSELVDFPLPAFPALTLSATLQWVDTVARHAFVSSHAHHKDTRSGGIRTAHDAAATSLWSYIMGIPTQRWLRRLRAFLPLLAPHYSSGGVYVLVSPCTRKFYFGKTNNFRRRLSEHLHASSRTTTRSNAPVHRLMKWC
eukprot:jgi/Ulvmu1/3308/UM153_0020.1